jgi:AcrR family transcriptional regulator
VAEALMELLRAGDPDPTAKAVAEQAGVSLRLVFHHFTDMDELYQFVASLQLRRIWSDLPQRSPVLARQRRIEWIVDHRAGLYEEISPIRRALVRRVPVSPGVRDAVAAADALLLENLKATFAPELDPLPVALRIETLDAMDTASSWEAWERLRSTSGVQPRAARRVMARMLESLCPSEAAAIGSGGAAATATGA